MAASQSMFELTHRSSQDDSLCTAGLSDSCNCARPSRASALHEWIPEMSKNLPWTNDLESSRTIFLLVTTGILQYLKHASCKDGNHSYGRRK
jgi:hypothetical protein